MPSKNQPVTNAPILPVDGKVPEWVHVLGLGTWLGHPVRPEIITPDHLRSALDYFERHYAVHGTDLVVDYHHASVHAGREVAKAPAAGWINAMELRAGGTELWGRVQWTSEAATEIARGEFRYPSPVVRFNAPDRVSGEPTLLQIHSVALTNTPFLTELESLNEAAALGGGGAGRDARPTQDLGGGRSMRLIEMLAKALEQKPEQVASTLGLVEGAEDDAKLAGALVANAARIKELEAEAANPANAGPAVTQAVANALGVEPSADEAAVRAAIVGLKAEAPLPLIKDALGLADDASNGDVLNAVAALKVQKRKSDAEELVDNAITAGKVPPARRELFVKMGQDDLEGTQAYINSLAAIGEGGMGSAGAGSGAAAGQEQGFTDAEADVMRAFGFSEETMKLGKTG